MMNQTTDVNTCRICIKTHDTLFSLYRKRQGTSPYEKLVKKTNLKIEFNDAGPSSICSQCLTDLDTTVTFLEKCELSNQILAAKYREVVEEESSIFKNNFNEFEGNNVETVECETKSSQSSQEIVTNAVAQNDVAEVNNVNILTEKCPECDSKRRCKHWSPPTSYKCQHCEKIFNKKFNFQLHLKRHLGKRDWPCPVCGSQQLTQFLAERHCRPKLRKLCPVAGCGKSFTTNTNLHTHIRTHSGERPFECDECGKRFTSKKTLKTHDRIHTGAKPYMCQICGKQFTTNHLSEHMARHAARRPHACPRAGCGRRFPSACGLRSHARSHAAARAYACALCSASYKYKQSLNHHVKKQHGVRTTCQQEITPKTSNECEFVKYGQ